MCLKMGFAKYANYKRQLFPTWEEVGNFILFNTLNVNSSGHSFFCFSGVGGFTDHSLEKRLSLLFLNFAIVYLSLWL